MIVNQLKAAIVSLCQDELEKREAQFGPKPRRCFPSWFPVEWDDEMAHDALCELLDEAVISVENNARFFVDGFMLNVRRP
ncbi:hypothetical protein [Pantoea sp.]|uniref:hypothetical protein n=1 Tax=Pantoea sp. TaxID=69393 RepID=UPI0028AB3480|nr:hypothetical protein [Pantoea sp.]